jgi:S-adenosylmethionine hydrolase
MAILTLTTDFGSRDWFVGTMKGVILQRAPRVTLVDLTHEIAPGDIRGAAFALRSSCRYFPRGTVHLVVVDPGVGSARAALAARTDGHMLVGPDNGVLSWVVAQGGSTIVRRIENTALFLQPLSNTFHGRDVFVPVAAYLAAGGRLGQVGPLTTDFVRLPWPEVKQARKGVVGEVIYVDRFGNAITNVTRDACERVTEGCGGQSGRVVLPSGSTCVLGACYASVQAGRPVGVIGSSGLLEIAIRGGNSVRRLGLRIGHPIRLEPRPS